ncbi:MAG: hybrid sensor histidine kinase/response regulator [Acidobacteriaceae bacterium]
MSPRTGTPNTKAARDPHDDFQDTFGTMAVGLVRLTPQGSLVAANPAYCQIVGYSLAELSAMNLTALVHPDDQKAHSSLVQKLLDGEFAHVEIEERYVKNNGDHVSVHSSFSLTRARNGASPDIVVVVREDPNRTERRELVADNDRLFDTLYSIGDGVVTVDMDEHLVFMNKVAENMTGWNQNEARGRPLVDIFRIVDQATREVRPNPVAEALSTGEIVELIQPTLLITKDGGENLIGDSVSPIYDQKHRIIGAVLVFRDITRKDRHEQELIKIQKLESVGVLAGGIAHDFNNILTIILGNVALAKLTDVDKHTLLSEAEAACFRARALTQQLLTFSNGGAPIKRVCGVAQLLREMTTLTLSGSNIRGVLKIATDVWPVEIDKNQIGQVINNLLLNAKYAMPQGGIVTIGAGNATILKDGAPIIADGAPIAQGHHISPGMYVRITVKDTGCGIPTTMLGKIFDPYFTTKDQGRGLGLAICYAIIQKHGGYIYGESVIDKGSCFSIYLPAWRGANQNTTTTTDTRIVFGSGKVLVMDDEEQVRAIAERLLMYFGYQVSLAKDGTEALSLYQDAYRAHTPFSAVILDITVPAGMSGVECMRKLQEFDPDVKVIISSGYATDPIMHDFKQYGFKDVVMKPYEVEEMSATMFRVTTEPTPAARIPL